MQFLYNLSVGAYGLALKLAAPFHAKARLWTEGRRNWQSALEKGLGGKKNWIWFHCASLGEFEQGRPLMEAIREQNPSAHILLTFFSPSGYEIRKNYSGANHVCYLPLDSPQSARQFLDLVQPKAVFFIKYEIWVHFLTEMGQRKIPLFLVSAMVRPNSRFVNGLLSPVFKRAFASFSWIFTQNEETQAVLSQFLNSSRISISGDTRFDRTVAIRNQFQPIAGMERFLQPEDFCIVCGSTWSKDEDLILKIAEELRDLPIKWVIAPHEINRIRILSTVSKYPYEMITWSAIDKCDPNFRMLWIDNIGMLSKLYHYAQIAYIGGGFGKAVHNTLEATAFGCPVIFGPNYKKFNEIVTLVERQGGFPILNHEDLKNQILRFFNDRALLEKVNQENLAFMQDSLGATEAILSKVREITTL
jgi:3-deoxy-D-manno-octulosonic-acid transferase